jgi:hypothetical protein
VRSIGWLSLLLLALGWLAAEVPLAKAPPRESLDAWRRTVDGWERPCWPTFREKVHRPSLHPLVVGLLEGLLASAALIAFSPHRGTTAPSSEHQRPIFSPKSPPEIT